MIDRKRIMDAAVVAAVAAAIVMAMCFGVVVAADLITWIRGTL